MVRVRGLEFSLGRVQVSVFAVRAQGSGFRVRGGWFTCP